jgi:hypothetical protein
MGLDNTRKERNNKDHIEKPENLHHRRQHNTLHEGKRPKSVSTRATPGDDEESASFQDEAPLVFLKRTIRPLLFFGNVGLFAQAVRSFEVMIVGHSILSTYRIKP